jgi:hypothetical protein
MLEIQVYDSEIENAPEQRLWRAVLVRTVQEWIHGTLRNKREAEQFLFQDSDDYRTVCRSAGIDPAHFRNRLEKLRAGTNLEALALALRN